MLATSCKRNFGHSAKLLFITLGMFSILFLANCSQKKSIQLTIGHTSNEQHPIHLALISMSEDLENRSDGNLKLKIYPNAQLGTERELIEQLQIGSISMTKVSSLSLEGFVPEMKVFGLPYLFEDNDHYWKSLNSELGTELLQSLIPSRLLGLGYFDAGSRSFYTKSSTVNLPADLRGMRIRVLPSEALIKTVDQMDGVATPIAFGELYSAIQQGVIDGAENNPPSYFLSRHFEVAPFYTLDEHVSAPDVIVISKRVWDDLTPSQQGWLKESMAHATTVQRKLWKEATTDALQKLENADVTIVHPNKAPFREAVATIYEEISGTKLGDTAQQIKSLAEPKLGN